MKGGRLGVWVVGIGGLWVVAAIALLLCHVRLVPCSNVCQCAPLSPFCVHCVPHKYCCCCTCRRLSTPKALCGMLRLRTCPQVGVGY